MAPGYKQTQYIDNNLYYLNPPFDKYTNVFNFYQLSLCVYMSATLFI